MSVLWAAMDVSAFQEVLLWLLVALVLLLVMGFVVRIVRRRATSDEQAEPQGPAFTLDDLRRLRDEEHLSDDEYDQMRKQIIAATSGKPVPPVERESKGNGDGFDLGDELIGPDADKNSDDPDER